MVPTVAWEHSGEEALYALDAGDYTAAAAVDWAIRLGLARNLADFDLPQQSSALEHGLVFVPALAGLAAPHWDRAAAGMWIGLRQDTTAADMRRAVLEGIALRSVELRACLRWARSLSLPTAAWLATMVSCSFLPTHWDLLCN